MKLHHVSVFKEMSEGMTLLLVILVLSALMTISLGIFNVIFIELRISGELTNSFQALYAADELMELAFYKDRNQNSACAAPSPDGNTACYIACTAGFLNCRGATQSFPQLASKACARVSVIKFNGLTTVRAIGQYDCGTDSFRVVRRAFEVSY